MYFLNSKAKKEQRKIKREERLDRRNAYDHLDPTPFNAVERMKNTLFEVRLK